MKRSNVLIGILLVMFVALAIVVFTVPQEILNNYELIFLWVVMPIMGGLWIRAYIDDMKGN